MTLLRHLLLTATGLLIAVGMCLDASAQPPAGATDYAAFESGLGRDVAARFRGTDKQWRQIAPSVYHLAQDHAAALARLNDGGRTRALAALAEFIEAKRQSVRDAPVLAPGRRVIGLLDPDRGLEPKEITAIGDAYGCESTIFKKAGDDQSLDEVAEAFLEAISAAVKAGAPTTVVVLGHGLPTEIQSYHIRFERLAAALLDGVARNTAVDFSKVVLICDDCFSADFAINLLNEVAAESRRRGLRLVSLPVCIAGTNRDRVGFVAVNELFVPHFWRDVIELYFIRQPRPKSVTLGNFFENVDNMMYGYGRAPIVENGHVTAYRLIDPKLVQDPVVFIPLDDEDLATLRSLLGLAEDVPLPRWLDIG